MSHHDYIEELTRLEKEFDAESDVEDRLAIARQAVTRAKLAVERVAMRQSMVDSHTESVRQVFQHVGVSYSDLARVLLAAIHADTHADTGKSDPESTEVQS